MIKITEKNRSLVFLAAIMIIGVIVMSVIKLTEDTQQTAPPPPKDVDVSFSNLNDKIHDLRNQNFDPTSYNTISTEINSYYKQDLITKDAQVSLIENLNAIYTDLVYRRCEFYLTGNKLNSNTDLLKWLSQLENITAKSNKTDYYRGQIKAYDYYSTTLPKKVSAFISPGITNYNDAQYYSYKSEVSNMPSLAEKYKNNQKFVEIKKQIIYNLEEFNAEWVTGGINESPVRIEQEKL